MKMEEIEKAAGDYSGSILGFRDNQFVMSKHKAFADGAEWRINSVWHDASEKPIEFATCLVELESQYGLFYKLKYFNKAQVKKWSGKYGCDKIIKWAYIEDLMPTKD